MTMSVDLRVVELLAARLCHDLIGPVAAVGNGAELLGEGDWEFSRDAVALVGSSARRANGRLQFYRFTYGYTGGSLAGPAPHQLATEFFAETAIKCEYASAARALPLEEQMLGCAMLALAGETLPRGGRLVLDAGAAGPEVDAIGEPVRPSPEARAALILATVAADLTVQTVGAYFAGLLAAAQGRRLAVTDRLDGFRISAAENPDQSSPARRNPSR